MSAFFFFSAPPGQARLLARLSLALSFSVPPLFRLSGGETCHICLAFANRIFSLLFFLFVFSFF